VTSKDTPVVSAPQLIEVLDSLLPALDASGDPEPGRAKSSTEAAAEAVELVFDADDPRHNPVTSDVLFFLRALGQGC
jgi:hypothetical protein